ncbi:MAG: LTA synthase family protein [Candidatus Liptonbacteria bacterium]|nr:LTA synthase family protein [Candidatus Liptonbacteria bacterium]
MDIVPPDPHTPPEQIHEENQLPGKPAPHAFLSRYGLLIFFAVAISYFELLYGLWTFRNITVDYIFPVLFALPAAAAFFLISVLFSKTINKAGAALITLALILMYGAQLVYYSIFHTPLSLYSLIGAEDAMQFWDIVASAILGNIVAVFLLFIPFLFLLLFGKGLRFSRPKPRALYGILLICIISFAVALLSVRATRGESFSQYALYYNLASPELSMRKLGVLTTMRLDLTRLAFGFEERNENGAARGAGNATPPPAAEIASPKTHSMTDINFENLIAKEEDPTLLDMHNYFSSIVPAKKNKHTGMFKGNNLIFMIAESFSPHAVSQELTPTLYKLSREGFVFNNFYNPLWGVSTSDGEYVSEMGILPKSGVWSALRSSANFLPFALGNQFKKLGYLANAYHDHTYTYYGRDKSLPNLGYNYKGVGNGLKVKVTWPESDLEMMQVTVPEYASSSPFHAYYITVSGHMNYNFYGNTMAAKNEPIVASSSYANYSNPAKAYLAANLELEFAVKSLLEQLEAAGVLDNTVLAIVPDNYPHGLPKKSLDELAGHTLETNFEIYKSIFILWKKGLGSIAVDRPAFTLDILPTLSNLFGLEYDSRLLMGRDVFGDAPPLVMFLNRSWITDKARYNSTVARKNEVEENAAYEEAINGIVADKFKYSTKILETDYYRKVILK